MIKDVHYYPINININFPIDTCQVYKDFIQKVISIIFPLFFNRFSPFALLQANILINHGSLIPFFLNPWNAASFWTLKNRVCHIWQKTLTGSREMKNIVLGDESPMTLSEMP